MPAMTVQPETIAPAAVLPVSATGVKEALSPRERFLADRIPGHGGFLARSLVPLNVMGGVAECAGALLLYAPLAETVSVAARRGPADQVCIHWGESQASNGSLPFTVSFSSLCDATGRLLPASELARRFERRLDGPECVLLGVLVEGIRAGVVFGDGSAGWSMGAVGCSGAVAASALAAPLAWAGLRALSALSGNLPDASASARVMRAVQHDWREWPLGAGDAHAVSAATSGGLWQIRGEASSVARVDLPPSLEWLAVDCGVETETARVANRRVRAAAAMGRVLVRRILEHETPGAHTWNGHLAGLSMNDYVERLRDRLPTKMKGRDFLERFGDPGDALAPVEPDFAYKVRSRTEHMIYEHARAVQLVEGLSRGARLSDAKAWKEAGDLLYASHWSYGQRCGLGSVETDHLVSELRGHGSGGDILGAKVCGLGCGGWVAVLARRTPRAEESLARACAAYQQKSKRAPHILRGLHGAEPPPGPVPLG